MIEVKLQYHERYHPARRREDLPPVDLCPWWGKKGSYWDMTFIEYASKAQLDTLQFSIEELFTIWEKAISKKFTHLIVDIEVCGSYAYGIQRWWSDFDIQLVCATYEDQRELEVILRGHHHLLKSTVRDLGQRLKHAIEVHYSVHDNKEKGTEVYSLRERKLYNRPEGVRRADSYRKKFKSKKDENGKEIGKYELEPRNKPFSEGDFWHADGREKPLKPNEKR